MARSSVLVLGLSKTEPSGPFGGELWFERLVDPDTQAALSAIVPAPFDARVAWPAPNLMKFGTPETHHVALDSWPQLREQLVAWFDVVHAREPVAFACSEHSFDVTKNATALLERIVPALLTYFGATSANEAAWSDPGAWIVYGCLTQVGERLRAGEAVPDEAAWRRLVVPSLGRSFMVDSHTVPAILRPADWNRPDADPRIVLAAFRQLPHDTDFLPCMAAVLDARSVNPEWFAEMTRDHALVQKSRARRRAMRHPEDRRETLADSPRAFQVIRRYRELGAPRAEFPPMEALRLARVCGDWPAELEIAKDLLPVSREKDAIRGPILEEALSRGDARVVDDCIAELLARAHDQAGEGSEKEALGAGLVTPALRELVRRGDRASATRVAVAYLDGRSNGSERDEILELLLRALSYDGTHAEREDVLARRAEQGVAYQARLRAEPPPRDTAPAASEGARRLAEMHEASQTKVSNVLPLIVAAWHGRRGRHERASELAATALEWGHPIAGVLSEPGLEHARALEPLATRLASAKGDL